MAAYVAKVREAMKRFKGVRMEQVPREKNHRAYVLAKIIEGEGHALPKGVPLQLVPFSSIVKEAEVFPVSRPPCWMDPIADYLQSDTLPTDPDQARRLKRIATRYCLVEGCLYRKGKSLPLLKCLHPDDARWVLNEIHLGDYGNHVSGETLAYQVIRMGYYWPTIHQDAMQFARSCEACQKTTNLHHLPPERLSSISNPYLFAIWGLDLIGPLPTAPSQAKPSMQW